MGAEIVIAAVSGGFDVITPGHVALFESAAKLGNVMAILNSDEWLIRKKGYFVFDWEERKSILLSHRGVVSVVPVDDADGTVCAALKEHKPDFFVNGGDRGPSNTPEVALCNELGIKMIFSGDPKISSSSMAMKRGVSERTWGKYELIYQGPNMNGYIKVKRLTLNPMSSTSLQKHKFRDEYFFPLDGNVIIQLADRRMAVSEGCHVYRGAWHSLVNESYTTSSVLEVQVGSVTDESDIERV